MGVAGSAAPHKSARLIGGGGALLSARMFSLVVLQPPAKFCKFMVVPSMFAPALGQECLPATKELFLTSQRADFLICVVFGTFILSGKSSSRLNVNVNTTSLSASTEHIEFQVLKGSVKGGRNLMPWTVTEATTHSRLPLAILTLSWPTDLES